MKDFSSASRSTARGAIAAAVAALALAGCANYAGISSDKQLAAPETLESTQSLPVQGGQWPTLDWATQFGDPQLPQLIDEALAGNPSIAQAQARIAKASSYIETSRSALYPKVTGSYSWTRELYSANALVPAALRRHVVQREQCARERIVGSRPLGQEPGAARHGRVAGKGRGSQPAAGARDARRIGGAHLQPARAALRAARHRAAGDRQSQRHRPHHGRSHRDGPRHRSRAQDRAGESRDEPRHAPDARRQHHHHALPARRAARRGPGSRLVDRAPVARNRR